MGSNIFWEKIKWLIPSLLVVAACPSLVPESSREFGNSPELDEAQKADGGGWNQPDAAMAISPRGDGGTRADAGLNPMIIFEEDESILCLPAGSGPFAGVLYNHGGLGQAVGGDLQGTCVALAEAGYVGYAKRRRETVAMFGHIDDVFDGLGRLLEVDIVDPTRIGIMGFSRGGLLTLMAAKDEPASFEATILMAPAPGNGIMESELEDVTPIRAPVLILVAENDTTQHDLVSLSHDVQAALNAADKEVQLIVYPPFGQDGHQLFFEVGDYWPDVLDFLLLNL